MTLYKIKSSSATSVLAPATTGTASDDASLIAFMRNMLSGGISGIVSKTIGAPVDRVKLILQTQAVNVDVKTRYTGLTDCFTRVYKEQGVCAWCICVLCMHGVYACMYACTCMHKCGCAL